MRRFPVSSGFAWLATSALVGCAGARQLTTLDSVRPERPVPAVTAPSSVEPPVSRNDQRKLRQTDTSLASNQVAAKSQEHSTIAGTPVGRSGLQTIQMVAHDDAHGTGSNQDPTLTINGQTYRLQLVENYDSLNQSQLIAADGQQVLTTVPTPAEFDESAPAQVIEESLPANTIRLDLASALSIVGGQHPAVGFAQWRVQEAYAQLDRADVLWLPSLQAGLSFHRHDGNYQASNGAIVDVNRNSFQYGLGTGATGAGTTPRPGVVAQFHLADALFQPEIAEKTAWARGHAANGVVNEQLLRAALAYLELLAGQQELRVVEETHRHADALSKLTSDFAASGQGLQSDADRMQTELMLVENRMAQARERIAVGSARLAREISLGGGQEIVPMDPFVAPIELVAVGRDKGSLIQTGLCNRPELKEAQALVAAACEQYQRQKYAPFVPSVLLGFSTGGFGGGIGNSPGDFDDRYDFDAILTWEVRNLGLGESAARRETEARVEQAKYESLRTMDRVAGEIAEAHAQVVHRAERIDITQSAIQTAIDSYERNLTRIRDGQGLPLEVLQSVQALESARRAYLDAVIGYNEAQFRLQWALGWPVSAPQ